MEQTPASRDRLAIRLGAGSLCFAAVGAADRAHIDFVPYDMRPGVSAAANLREAFKECPLLAEPFRRATVLVDSLVLLVPQEEFDPQTAETLYRFTFASAEKSLTHHVALPDLNAVAVFGLNKDFRLVVSDHFADMRFVPVALPVWTHFHHHSFGSTRPKLYAYFHDERVEVFMFKQNRFRFCNAFPRTTNADATYYMLNVWRQLCIDDVRGELYLSGSAPEAGLADMLHRYISNVYEVRPTVELRRAAPSQVEGMPFDLMLHLSE